MNLAKMITRRSLALRENAANKQNILVDVEHLSEDIKPIIRSIAGPKEKNVRTVKFHDRNSVCIIAPLHGWKQGVVRMPIDTPIDEDDGTETHNIKVSKELELTPNSREKIEKLDRRNNGPLYLNVFAEKIKNIKNEADKTPRKKNSTTAGLRTRRTKTEQIKKFSDPKRLSSVNTVKLNGFIDNCEASSNSSVEEKIICSKKEICNDTAKLPIINTETSTIKKGSSNLDKSCPAEQVSPFESSKSAAENCISVTCEKVLENKTFVEQKISRTLPTHPLKMKVHRKYDHAPFSRFNVLPTYIEPVIDPTWTLPPKRTPISFYKKVDSTKSKAHFLPVISSKTMKEVINVFNQDIRAIWYNHALNSRQKAKTLAWPQALQPTASALWLGSKSACDQVKNFVEERWKQRNKKSYRNKNEKTFSPIPFIIEGPTGSGKTSLVHSIAADFDCIIQNVDVGIEHSTLSKRCFFPKSIGLRNKSTKNAILLVEDIDIYFKKYDQGFYRKLENLIAQSDQPVILTCTKIPQEYIKLWNYKTISLDKFNKKVVALYASVCVFAFTEKYIDEIDLMNILQNHVLKQDIRGLLNQLQFDLISTSLPILIENRYYKRIGDLNYEPCDDYPYNKALKKSQKIDYHPIIQKFVRKTYRPQNYKTLRAIMNLLYNLCSDDVARDYIPFLLIINRWETSIQYNINKLPKTRKQHSTDFQRELKENISKFVL